MKFVAPYGRVLGGQFTRVTEGGMFHTHAHIPQVCPLPCHNFRISESCFERLILRKRVRWLRNWSRTAALVVRSWLDAFCRSSSVGCARRQQS